MRKRITASKVLFAYVLAQVVWLVVLRWAAALIMFAAAFGMFATWP
jgi:hypothetical protein